MKLHNVIPTKPNTKFLFNGTVYGIDADGNVEVPDEVGEELLKMDAWQAWSPDSGQKQKPKSRGTIGLVTNTGDVVAKEPEPEAAPEEPVDEPVDEGDAEAVEPESGTVEDPPIPDDEGEWADPKPEYSREWLEVCAEAYEVAVTKRMKNDTLVKRIMEAMYPDE